MLASLLDSLQRLAPGDSEALCAELKPHLASLISHELGRHVVTALTERSAGFRADCEGAWLDHFEAFSRDSCALGVAQGLLASPEFGLQLFRKFKGFFAWQGEQPVSPDQLRVLGALVRRLSPALGLQQALDQLEAELDQLPGQASHYLVQVLLRNADAAFLTALARILLSRFRWFVTKSVGYRAICAMIVNRVPEVVGTFEKLGFEYPTLLFVGKYRRVVFLTYIQHLVPRQARLAGHILDYLTRTRSDLRYTLKKETSVSLLLALICANRRLQVEQIQRLGQLVDSICENGFNTQATPWVGSFRRSLTALLRQDYEQLRMTLTNPSRM